mgnify:CR=1 FL=1
MATVENNTSLRWWMPSRGIADGENRMDSVTYKNFVGDVGSVAARDVLTRVDSLTNSDRKGILKQTSVEEGSPYLDVLYGMKTDPDNAVRTRLGRLVESSLIAGDS